ncbi:MAG: NAD-dependent epimerase/dehydratase family protein, partial [Alphaproteobacteria bacterium]|nr:NAD-dependent epimerase/dehydratase family protein [Alphaproteobacteria bacterium]
CRALGARPRVVFASSVAVFGGKIPQVVTDDTPVTPETSYGAQKAMGELMISDFSRKGFLDGRALRLPTIVVRPGKPNLAASSFASGILREPLTGVETTCPVPASTIMPLMSPRRVIECFITAHEMDAALFGASRAITLPGLAATVDEMLAALERIAGPRVRARVRFVPEERIMRIVKTWPQGTDSALARRAGMRPNERIDDLIHQFIEDDLGGKPVI